MNASIVGIRRCLWLLRFAAWISGGTFRAWRAKPRKEKVG